MSAGGQWAQQSVLVVVLVVVVVIFMQLMDHGMLTTSALYGTNGSGQVRSGRRLMADNNKMG